MNPLQRRKQIVLALACVENNISINDKVNKRRRLREVENLVNIAMMRLPRIEDEKRPLLESRISELKEEIKKKKRKYGFKGL